MLENLSINLHRDKAFSRQVKILQVNAAPTGYHPQELATLLAIFAYSYQRAEYFWQFAKRTGQDHTLRNEHRLDRLCAERFHQFCHPIPGDGNAEFKIMTSIIDNKNTYSPSNDWIRLFSQSSLRTISYMNKSLQTYSVTIAESSWLYWYRSGHPILSVRLFFCLWR